MGACISIEMYAVLSGAAKSLCWSVLVSRIPSIGEKPFLEFQCRVLLHSAGVLLDQLIATATVC